MLYVAIPKVFEEELNQVIEYLHSKTDSLSKITPSNPGLLEGDFKYSFSKILPSDFKIYTYEDESLLRYIKNVPDALWKIGIPHIYIDLPNESVASGMVNLLSTFCYLDENNVESFELHDSSSVSSYEILEALEAFEHPRWVLPKTLNNLYLALAFKRTRALLDSQERIALKVKAKLMIEGSLALNYRVFMKNSSISVPYESKTYLSSLDSL